MHPRVPIGASPTNLEELRPARLNEVSAHLTSIYSYLLINEYEIDLVSCEIKTGLEQQEGILVTQAHQQAKNADPVARLFM
jgi:hypothetical protein